MQKPLAHAIALAFLASNTHAAEADGRKARELDAIVVTASPLNERADQTTQPIAVIAGQELTDRVGAQAGSAVEHLPGVQSSFFGAGVGRPIIRGLEGARVQVLSGGLSSMDASTVSPDHAVAIEPFLADQIEVLKGPATLLYGSGAIGGVVNIADGRLPETAKLGLSGRTELSGDTGSNQRLGAIRLDQGHQAAAGTWMLHADAVYRDQDDYDVPDTKAPLLGTSLESRNAALSASYLSDVARFGVSVSQFKSLYGIPEALADEPAAPSALAKATGEEGVRIDLDQNRIDASGALLQLGDFVEQVDFRFGRNRYQHVELEGGEQGTLFDVDSHEVRLEAVHAPLLADGKGAFGLSSENRDFKAVGAEAFVPFSKSQALGFFTTQHVEAGAWHSDFGVRFDRVKLDAVGQTKRTDNLSTLAFSTRYDMPSGLQLSVNADRSQRAPVAEELYSDGAHIATQSFELGDASLKKETALNLELGLHYHTEATHFSLNAYRNRFNDFIYQQAGGELVEDLPLQLWTQADARFTGFEAQLSHTLTQSDALGSFTGEIIADRVRATLDSGGNLQRIAPQRFGANLVWELGDWHARISVMRYGKQTDLAPLETPTAGYTRVDLDVSRAITLSNTISGELFLRARNATDQLARAHTSFLKDFAPLPGRNLGLGVRFYW